MVHRPNPIDGFTVDLVPASHLLFVRYADKPGVVGRVGALLGDAGVNIAGMQVARVTDGGETLMALTLDSQVPAEVLAQVGPAVTASSVRAVDLVDG